MTEQNARAQPGPRIQAVRIELLETALSHLAGVERPFWHLSALLTSTYDAAGCLRGERLGYAVADGVHLYERLWTAHGLGAWVEALPTQAAPGYEVLREQIAASGRACLQALSPAYWHLAQILVAAYEGELLLEGEALGAAVADAIVMAEALEEWGAWLRRQRSQGMESEGTQPIKLKRVK